MTAFDDTAAAELARKDRAHALHPWGEVCPSADNGFMVEGDGAYIRDLEGHRLLDGVGGLWCVNIGYGRREMAEAIAAQVMRLPFYSAFIDTASIPATELSARLAEATPGDLSRVFLTTGGSTANDSAIRFLHFLFNRTGRAGKKHIITRADAYHGSTYLTASVSGKFSDLSDLDVLSDQVHHLPSVNPYRRPAGMSLPEFCDEKVADLERKILELGPETVAGFIAEPVLASGGVIVPPEGYHRRTLEVCRKYDVKYISDEVVTGFGRLGHLFASESVFDLVPDIITCAKGLTSGYVPLGAMILSETLCREASCGESAAFSNGFTYSGHPVACAAALTNIAILEREDLCGHVRRLAPYFMEHLGSLRDLPLVGDVRGMGFLAGVEFVADKTTARSLAPEVGIGKRIGAACRRRGVMVRPLGAAIGISPPLTIGREQIDILVSALRSSILEAADELTREGVRLAS
ncbi:aminotransferase [Rhodospirillaceae bacterium SYSU D60014]|uniref:aminotransferase n=1 Tax=Virgifigura deserti TaxID=2268457 RepID=UPI000E66A1A7